MRIYEKNIATSSSLFNHIASSSVTDKLLYVLCSGVFLYEPGYYLSRSSYDSFLVMLVLDGEITFELNNETATAHKGDVAILDCYIPHKYYTEHYCHSIWAHFDGSHARYYYDNILAINGFVFTPNYNAYSSISENLNKICSLLSGKYPSNLDFQLSNMLTGILTSMTEIADHSQITYKHAHEVNNIVKYINENLADELDIGTLAEMASFSKYHFLRIFTDTMGITPKQYIINARIEYSKYLLITTNLSILEIANATGYASECLFSNAFKKKTGETPSCYRQIRVKE